jgi:Spy/CpxP family protein refolding chaperone
MKNLLFIALLFASTAAFANNTSPASPSTPPGQSGGPGDGERFDQIKAKILAHLQEKQACVQAATTREALHACMPHMGEHRGEGKGGGFGGGRLNNNGNNGQSENAPGQQ